jgi:hypothetical protein
VPVALGAPGAAWLAFWHFTELPGQLVSAGALPGRRGVPAAFQREFHVQPVA